METDPIRALGPLPQSIDASDTISKRIAQVSDLVDVIHRGGRVYKPRTVVQRLPRHMRRRAMSHNVKRLPRKRRDYGKSAIAKSNHRKKPPSRMKRRRPRNLQKEYKKRASEIRWLLTHIFHAKRFEMISLWNYKIPLRSYQRGVKPFLRDAKWHTVVFDDSYYRTLKILFRIGEDVVAFQSTLRELREADYSTVKGPELHVSGYSVVYCNSTEVVLSVHPMFCKDIVDLMALFGLAVERVGDDEIDEKSKICYFATEKPLEMYCNKNVMVFDVSNMYAKFSFYGQNTVPCLNNLVTVVADDDLSERYIDYKECHKGWRSFVEANGVNAVADSTCYSVLIEDPRLKMATRLVRESCVDAKAYKEFTDKRVEKVKYVNTLFDRVEIEDLISKHQTTAAINQLRSSQLAQLTTLDYKVPVTFNVRNTGTVVKVEMFLPALSASSMMSSLYRSGVRVGSLSDRFVMSVEFGDQHYPYFFLPLTTDKASFRWKRYQKMTDVKNEAFGKWNEIKSFDYILSSASTLGKFQSMVRENVRANLRNLPANVLVPVSITVQGKGHVTDDDLIFPIERYTVDESSVQMGVVRPTIQPDLLMDFKPNSIVDIHDLFAAPRVKKPRKAIVRSKVLDPIGKVVYARHSLVHGITEAFGYVELTNVVDICKNNGNVALKNVASPNFVKAKVSFRG
ncbi:unnamed protein product [Bursaphelenchus okinawaensis]|uniref:Pop1 N-terminal domain-containing protein n=1 Tax=Bursaphelenchus okinawaensis TaxID=465554 RepID=A0A811K6H8_9BILA|nr:unnamed protein product [Bursaphelenchus okinawaensis]CAG9093221.1 unnamed protein product [Bursaphelenchus okinawaensis]